MKYLLAFFLFPLSALAVKVDLSGNLEAQGRKTWNNEEAKQELMQGWDHSEFYMLYGNLGAKIDIKGGSLALYAFNLYGAAMAFYYAVADCKTQPCSLSNLLCGEKGIKYSFQNINIHSHTCVTNGQ